jgi:hypothetical protein
MPNLKFKPLINTIFIHIPKTAGMSLFGSVFDLDKFFSWFLGLNFKEEDKIIDNMEQYKSITLGHIYYKSLLEENYMSIKYYKKAFKFCFVRNPYDRIVSLYKYHKIQERLNLNFDDFIEILYTEFKNKTIPPIGLYNVKHFNKNSKLFHKYITGNQYNQMTKWIPKDIGFIGRYENLEVDVNTLLKILGYEGKNIIIPKLNFSLEKSNYRSYYKKDETIKYVRTIYKRDIIRFGYKF